MSRARIGLILWVALGYAGAPLALDACARSCAGAAPACHHERSASQHIGHAPELCGYEHDAVRAAPPSVRISTIDALVTLVANLAVMRPEDTRPLLHRGPHQPGGPPLAVPIRASVAPLRI